MFELPPCPEQTKRGLLRTRAIAAEISATVARQTNDTGRLLLAERTTRNLNNLAKRWPAISLQEIIEA